MRGSYEISASSVFLNLMKSIQSNVTNTKIFPFGRIQRGYRKNGTAHYTRRNANLNLILFAAKLRIQLSNNYIFINEIVGVRLTWFDCITIRFVLFCKWIIFGSNCGAN